MYYVLILFFQLLTPKNPFQNIPERPPVYLLVHKNDPQVLCPCCFTLELRSFTQKLLNILFNLASGINSCNLTGNLLNPYVIISCLTFCFHLLFSFVLSKQLELVNAIWQAVEHCQLPQNLNFKWCLSGLAGKYLRKSRHQKTTDHVDSTDLELLQQ